MSNIQIIAGIAMLAAIGGYTICAPDQRAARNIKRRRNKIAGYTKNPSDPAVSLKIKKTLDQIDLIPSVGCRGSRAGWCLVQYRLKKQYPQGLDKFRQDLIKNDFQVNKLDNQTEFEYEVYPFYYLSPTAEQAPYFNVVHITSHVLMMMDFRGITMVKLRNAVSEFLIRYKRFMLSNYSKRGYLMMFPPLQQSDMTVLSCQDYKKMMDSGIDPDTIDGPSFILRDKGAEYVFRVSGINSQAKSAYEIFKNLIIVTAIQVDPPHIIDASRCDDNLGILLKRSPARK